MAVLKRYNLSPLSDTQSEDISSTTPKKVWRGLPSDDRVVVLEKIKTTPASPEPKKIAEPQEDSDTPALTIDHNKLREHIEEDMKSYRKKMEAEIQQLRESALAGLEKEKITVRQKAYDEGYQDGLKKGESSLSDQSVELLQTIQSAIAEKNKLLKKTKGEILRLALKVAEQIIKSEISLNQAVCVNIVAEAIGKITDKDKIIIRVNRADVDFVNHNKDRLLKHIGEVKNLIIQEDSRIEQGGCIIETDMGYIDSTIETKLASIERAIYKVYDDEEEQGDPS